MTDQRVDGTEPDVMTVRAGVPAAPGGLAVADAPPRARQIAGSNPTRRSTPGGPTASSSVINSVQSSRWERADRLCRSSGRRRPVARCTRVPRPGLVRESPARADLPGVVGSDPEADPRPPRAAVRGDQGGQGGRPENRFISVSAGPRRWPGARGRRPRRRGRGGRARGRRGSSIVPDVGAWSSWPGRRAGLFRP